MDFKSLDFKKYYPQEIQCSEQIARKLLSLYGGEAYTEYIDKNGVLYKTTSLATINNYTLKKSSPNRTTTSPKDLVYHYPLDLGKEMFNHGKYKH